MIDERLTRLRTLMLEKKIDVFIIPTADYHESEYVDGYFRSREYLTGFTGSAGTAVVSRDCAALFTDGRYFIQAEKEIQGSGFTLYRSGTEGVPTPDELTSELLPEGGTIGFDGRCVNAEWGLRLQKIAESRGGSLHTSEDLPGMFWTERPARTVSQSRVLGEEYAGESVGSKIGRVRERMDRYGANAHILTSLDDIAWLLNIRADDIPHVPVLLSYLLLTKKGCVLYADPRSLGSEVKAHLAGNGIVTAPYEDIYRMAEMLGEKSVGSVLMDLKKVNYRIYSLIAGQNRVINRENPEVLMKAVKNRVEQDNIRSAHVKDGIAMTKWLYWLKTNIGKIPMTEITVSDRLQEFRQEQEGFLDLSFDTISAYKGNAAMMHYSAVPGQEAALSEEGFLLVDSGGHYREGSTDITRTVVLGPVTDEEKHFYTSVLRGNLNLAGARFLQGCTGRNLDILARGPLWEEKIDYQCGTGHGIGYQLNVHEAPNGFRWKAVPERRDGSPLLPGMVTTDEPGVYFEGRFGIRLENELLCVRDGENEYGMFLSFENLTLCPFDLAAVNTEEMSRRERELLNAYHRKVYDTLSPYLTYEERLWLRYETREV